MNDFTKEELEILQRAMNYWVGENAGKVIKNKIQSMIDNHCVHEWHNHCPECNPLNIYCKKCRTYLREQNTIVQCDDRCS